MDKQLKLLPETKPRLDIKSPVFQAQPGWGGQLKKWLSCHFESGILPIVALATLAIGIYLVAR